MKLTDKTLLEQLQISEQDIALRMTLLGLEDDCMSLLASHRGIIEERIDDIVEEFYQQQVEIEEISLLIGDADTLQRLCNAQRRYTLEMFCGYCDVKYVNSRLRIGVVHKRIGVKPMLYLSALRALKEILINTLRSNISNKQVANETINALDKLFYFDTTLVFDTYIDGMMKEVVAAKKRSEDYALSLEDKIAERTKYFENQAKMDALTGIYNAKAMRQMLRRELALAKRQDTKLSLVYFDIDHFKSINDQHGHVTGDEVLKKVGQALSNNVRETDIACRYGGDEFCLLLPDCGIDKAKTICEKIISEFSSYYPNYSFSMGIAETAAEENIDEEELIKMADARMYNAKKQDGFQIRI